MRDGYFKKGLVIGIILLFIGASIVPSISGDDGNIIYVDDDADPSWYDATHVKTITEGINNASAGDTVYVYSGTYYETSHFSSPYNNVFIDKSIDLIGENRDTTVIDGGGSGNVVCIYFTADWVSISGFTITNTSDQSGVFLYTSNNNVIFNNYITNNLFGINLQHSSNNIISDNLLLGNNRDGIRLTHNSKYNHISNNNISNNNLGIYLYDSNNNTISDNSILNNKGEGGIRLFWAGEEYKKCDNNIISGNRICYNEYGIYFYDSTDDNIIYHNNFVNNAQNARDYGNNTWDDGYPSGGNYWSDYTGVDYYHGPNQDIPDSDGIGDTPYNVAGDNNQDKYPFTNENGWINQPPESDAGGPYQADEGSEITFNASGSTDPNEDELQYRWDFDNDGTWDTNYSTDPTATYAWYDDYNGTAKVEVYDGEYTDTDTGTVAMNNVAPMIISIDLPIGPVPISTEVNLTGNFTDPGWLDTHTATIDWGDGNSSTGDITGSDGYYTVTDSWYYAQDGVYTITLTVIDDDNGSDTEAFRYVVVYNPDGGFVTGGGWIDSPAGAYTPDSNFTGKANFGFVSKYKEGQQTPTGNTEFNFKVADLNFHSNEYDWLVVAGKKAMYKGNGTINNQGNYGFLLSAIDGDLQGGDGDDKFRIKIWDKDDNDTAIYDNMLGEEEDADPTTVIDGGNIRIQKD